MSTITRPRPPRTSATETLCYRLEQLYVDQAADFVVDAIPSLLVWLTKHFEGQPARIRLWRPDAKPVPITKPASAGDDENADDSEPSSDESLITLELTWNVVDLAAFDPSLQARVARTEGGRTMMNEHTTELAGYGLALVAMSALLRERVLEKRIGLPPDLLYDIAPNALRGVEVAARTHGSWSTLRDIRQGVKGDPGKATQLIGRSDVVEAYLSLWCAVGRCSEFAKVKP